jgi:hypothetical protein
MDSQICEGNSYASLPVALPMQNARPSHVYECGQIKNEFFQLNIASRTGGTAVTSITGQRLETTH